MLDTTPLPGRLMDYLSLYTAVILESPVLKNGGDFQTSFSSQCSFTFFKM